MVSLLAPTHPPCNSREVVPERSSSCNSRDASPERSPPPPLRQHGGGPRCVRAVGDVVHLPDQPGDVDGRDDGRVGVGGPPQRVRPAGARDDDAERGRRRRRGPRLARRRRPLVDVHGVAGAAADGAQPLPDRGRADANRLSRVGADGGEARALDLQRPLRRDGVPPDGVRPAVLAHRAGVHGPRARRPPLDAQDADPLHALLRRLPHVGADQQDQRHPVRRDRQARPRGRRPPEPPRRRAEPEHADHPRHGAAPRHLHAERRRRPALLRRGARARPAGDGRGRRDDRPPVQAVRLPRPPRGRPRGGGDGLVDVDGAGGGRLHERVGRAHGPPQGAVVPPVGRRRAPRRDPAVGKRHHRVGPHS